MRISDGSSDVCFSDLSTCAHGGKIFARYWLHNGFLNIDSQKMSKSVGNVLLVHELLKTIPGEVIRLVLMTGHYRQPVDWNDEVVAESRKKLDRLYGALDRKSTRLNSSH